MILQSLVNYYDALSAQGKIMSPGWSSVGVSFGLALGDTGALLDIVSLRRDKPDGKNGETLPRPFELPAPVTRTVGIKANFLWDNSSYLLGRDQKGKPARAAECFRAAAELHQNLLAAVDTPAARAVKAFFRTWQPGDEAGLPLPAAHAEEVSKGVNLIFLYNGQFVHDEPQIRAAWQSHYDGQTDTELMQCLITGKSAPVAVLHPAIKGVRGAQSTGAALVSFNATAYESYGRDKGQGQNAPVSQYAAFAYTTALNQLLADRRHMQRIGDTTLVFWAENGEPAYQGLFSVLLNGGDETIDDNDLQRLMKALAQGESVDWAGSAINARNHFYILGLAPNAARLSVRFFLQDEFGHMVANLRRHHQRLEIIKPSFATGSLPLWKLLSETVNKNANDKTPAPQMAGATLLAILNGGRYPATLYNNVLLRIRAEHEISHAKAALIKAYLLRNSGDEKLKEVLTVELNEQSKYLPYVLGRLFSILEQVQEAANPGIKATIRDRYFNSACATPAVIFPLLIKLSGSHLRKLDISWRINYERQITGLLGLIDKEYPQQLSLPDQGTFQLGYYHQTQKRYEKKADREEK